MDKETTKEEILQAITEFAGHTEERFDKIDQKFDKVDQKFDKVDQRFDEVDQRFDRVDQRFDKLESRVDKIESQMVTKDYLDDKLADLRGDLVVLMRKEDHKVAALVDILKQRKVLTDEDVKKIMSMEPFPQIT